MKRGTPYQRGAALLVMMALLAMGGAWMLVSSLNKASQRAASDRVHNARVLAEAKQALLGWIATNALDASENNPGRLPCPEAGAYFGTTNEGIMASSCGPTATVQVGRLPWRSLGISKLLDAAGEPLWYVIGNSSETDWTIYNTTTATLKINSDSKGQLTVDDQANAAIALIIAPGKPFAVSTSTNCTARTQLRSATTLDLRDYLECQNASSPADATFVTSGPSASFNDQVVQVTSRDVLPLLEASIATRIERDIVPVLKTVYSGSEWGLSASDTVYPFAAPFADPGSSTYQGAAGQTQGLLPFNYTSSSCPVGDSRCSAGLVSWGTPTTTKTSGSASLWPTVNCYVYATYSYCQGWYNGGNISLEMNDPAMNVAMGMRKLASGAAHTSYVQAYDYNTSVWTYPTGTTSRRMNSDGSAGFVVSATFPSASGWGLFYVYSYHPAVSSFEDHAILDSSNAATGWFVRNEWYRSTYYAIASSQAANGASPRNCQDASGNCLTVTNLGFPNSTLDVTNRRAILVLTGRSLANATRPNATLSDYLDNAANRDGDASFTQDKVGPSNNDRLIVLDRSS